MSIPLSLQRWRSGPPTSGILREGESDRKPVHSGLNQPTLLCWPFAPCFSCIISSPSSTKATARSPACSLHSPIHGSTKNAPHPQTPIQSYTAHTQLCVYHFCARQSDSKLIVKFLTLHIVPVQHKHTKDRNSSNIYIIQCRWREDFEFGLVLSG